MIGIISNWSSLANSSRPSSAFSAMRAAAGGRNERASASTRDKLGGTTPDSGRAWRRMAIQHRPWPAGRSQGQELTVPGDHGRRAPTCAHRPFHSWRRFVSPRRCPSARRHVETALAAHREDGDMLLPVFFSANIGMFSSLLSVAYPLAPGIGGTGVPLQRGSHRSRPRTGTSVQPGHRFYIRRHVAASGIESRGCGRSGSRGGRPCRQYDFSYYRAFAARSSWPRPAHTRHRIPHPSMNSGQALDVFRATGSESAFAVLPRAARGGLPVKGLGRGRSGEYRGRSRL